MEYIAIEGMVSGLERTTQVSGGGETQASTTHICILNLQGERVLLSTPSPAMIANGDWVRLAGVRGQGQFSAIACRNISTGWATVVPPYGIQIALLSVFFLIMIMMTVLFSLLFIIMPLFCTLPFFFICRERSRQKKAHRLVE